MAYLSPAERFRLSVQETVVHSAPASTPERPSIGDLFRKSVQSDAVALDGPTISARTARRRVKEIVDVLVGMSATPGDLKEVVAGLNQSSFIKQCVGKPEQSVNDQIVKHLGRAIQQDKADSGRPLSAALSSAMASADIPVRAQSNALKISRYRLTEKQPTPKSLLGNSRVFSDTENVYVQEWILHRLVPLNDQRRCATRKIDGRIEHHQWYEDFVGQTASWLCFMHEHRDHPRYAAISKSKFVAEYAWYSREGTISTCVCVLHLLMKLLWADYARLSAQFHRAFAAQFVQLPAQQRRSEIACQTCVSHPFNVPSTDSQIVRTRQTMSTHAAVTCLQCPDATTGGAKASALCAGLVDDQTCESCGWENKIPTCQAE
jgi:hypothetical protein